MNNEQFRRLLITNNRKSKDGLPSKTSGTPGRGALGTRQKSTIPMTPRSVNGSQIDFSRQLTERNRAAHPEKRFKSAAPRGVSLAVGYTDRSKDRDEAPSDDRETRLKALEESLKKGDIEQDTYDKLRSQIAGGDLASTHLVKGLDFKLLERIRRGEDVHFEATASEAAEDEPEEAVDDELDKLGEREIEAVSREPHEKKKGELSIVKPVAGRKRTRDEILAELRASREARKMQQENSLSGRFKKIGVKHQPGTRREWDSKGREVLIIVDEDGHEKRKIRKVPGQPETEDTKINDLLQPDRSIKPLGMEVPEQYRKAEMPAEDVEDVGIFSDAGDDYDPLAGIDDSDSAEEQGEEKSAGVTCAPMTSGDGGRPEDEVDEGQGPPPSPGKSVTAPTGRDYFKDSKTKLLSTEQSKAPSWTDPTMMAAIKKAASLGQINKSDNVDDEDDNSEDADEAKAKAERRRRMLQVSDRDNEDLDMGFGTSRLDDEEDFEDKKVKLAVWGQDDDGEGRDGRGQRKRKRGPKKRKGDGNNAADVLRVMEQRKK